LDEEQRIARTALLAEILFPNTDADGLPGLDLAEAEQIGATLQLQKPPVRLSKWIERKPILPKGCGS